MRVFVKVPIDGKGGMILLSTDVNATADRRLRGWLTAIFWTVWHRLLHSTDPGYNVELLPKEVAVIFKSYDTGEFERIRVHA